MKRSAWVLGLVLPLVVSISIGAAQAGADGPIRRIQDPHHLLLDLTHKNIQSNPSATYLFREDGPGYHGKRLYLTRIREEKNSELISSLSRRTYPSEKDRRESKFLVFFKLEKERPLVGG